MAKIMVVDDDPTVCNLVNMLLKNEHKVIEADSLYSARELLAYEKPQVVLIDHQLSDGEGDELVKNDEVGDASCVLITAFSLTSESRAEMLDMGFLYVVQKPFEIKEIGAIVNRSYQHWKTKTELKFCASRGFKPESVKRLREAASVFRNMLASSRAFFF